MDNSGGITASLQGRYASALYALAGEHKAVAVVESDLARLGAVVDISPDLTALIRSPRITRAEAGAAMGALARRLELSELVRNFMGVLAANRRLAILPDAIRAFAAIAAAARGEIGARVTSAHPLAPAQIKALGARLKEREGRDVRITAAVDPALLGGLVVRIGSIQIDGSIRTRLNSLAQAMKG